MIYKGESNLYRAILIGFYPLLKILWNPLVNGTENIPPDGGAILVCNHRSLWDPVELGFVVKCRQVYYMAKAELFKIKVFGWFLRKINGFPVNRHTADISSIKNALKITSAGHMFGIFPEGTRTRKSEMLPFQKGISGIALRANVPIIPAFIQRKRFRGRLVISFGKPINLNSIITDIPKHEQIDWVTDYLQNAVKLLGEANRRV